MGSLGWQETVFIFVLALLIFGPKKLPELGKTIGKAMSEFRRASSELKATFDREMSSIERENESLKEVTQKYTSDLQDYDSYYDSGTYTPEPHDSIPTTNGTVGASAPQGAELTQTANGAVQTAENPGKKPEPPAPLASPSPETEAVKS